MYLHALEDEVEALGAEVTRLRIMLHRVTQVMQAPCPPEHADPLSSSPHSPGATARGDGDRHSSSKRRGHGSQDRQSRHRQCRQQRRQRSRSPTHTQPQTSSATLAELAGSPQTEQQPKQQQQEQRQEEMPQSRSSVHQRRSGVPAGATKEESARLSSSESRGLRRGGRDAASASQAAAVCSSSPQSGTAATATHESATRRDGAAAVTVVMDAESEGPAMTSTEAAPATVSAQASKDAVSTTVATPATTLTSTTARRTTDDAMVSLVRTLREQTAKAERDTEDETSSGVMLDSCLARPASNAISSATSQPTQAAMSSSLEPPRRAGGAEQPKPNVQRMPRAASTTTTSTSGGSTPAIGTNVIQSIETSQGVRGVTMPPLSTSPIPPRAAGEVAQRSQNGSRSAVSGAAERGGESAVLARSQSLQESEGNGCAYSALGLYDMIASTPPTSSLLLRTKSEPSLVPSPGSLPLHRNKMSPPPVAKSHSEEESSTTSSSVRSRGEEKGDSAAKASGTNAQRSPPRTLVTSAASGLAGRVPGIRTPQAKGGILERLRAQARSSTSSAASTDDESAVHRRAARRSTTSRQNDNHRETAQLAGKGDGGGARATSSPAMTLSAAKQMYGASLRDSFRTEMAGVELMLESNSNVDSPNQGPHNADLALAGTAAGVEEASVGRSGTLDQSPQPSSYGGGYDYNICLDASRSGQSIMPLATSSSAAQLRSTGRLGTVHSRESNDAQGASERYYDF